MAGNENQIVIQIARIEPHRNSDIPVPEYMTPHSSGMDIYAAPDDDVCLTPGSVCLIPTGFAMAIPPGYEAQIRPRSGIAAKHGIGIINSPGTIDADYRGEIMVPMINFGQKPFTIRRGDRIAQMVIQQVFHAKLQLTDQLDKTDRNTGGFGHTGL